MCRGLHKRGFCDSRPSLRNARSEREELAVLVWRPAAAQENVRASKLADALTSVEDKVADQARRSETEVAASCRLVEEHVPRMRA